MKNKYRGYRFPQAIISCAVWYLHRFQLSFRDIEDLLAERGIVVSIKAFRLCRAKFGPVYSSTLRKHTRQYERRMRRFKVACQAQRFLAVQSQVHNLFRIGRQLMRVAHYRAFRDRAFADWRQVTCA